MRVVDIILEVLLIIMNYYYLQFQYNYQAKSMNKYVLVIALINGMIGGLILVLPILALNGGTILSFLIILTTGFFSFYSCYLCIIHLGDCSDLDKAILQHFNQSKAMRVFYDLLVFFNLLFVLMLYFNLIVTQWTGLLGYNIANPICNAIALVVLTFILNYFHFGAKLLGYGIISIVGYCLFLIWLVSSAPSGPSVIPQFGTGAVNLAASMGQAFSIQSFFIPVIRQLPQSTYYVRYVLIAYIVGGSVYMYIAFAGSFGIVNRPTVPPNMIDPQTIQNYFATGQWQVAIVEVIYLIHLYSAYGQFLLICKKRFFNIFQVRESKHGQLLNPQQVVFVIILIAITVGIFFGKVKISTLIQINGAILGFFFIYLLPAAMHFVCLYYPGRKKDRITIQVHRKIQMEMQLRDSSGNRQQMLQMTERVPSGRLTNPINQSMEMKTEKSASINMQAGDKSQSMPVNSNTIQIKFSSKVQNLVSCTCQRPRKGFQVLDIIFMFGMVGLGAFIMVDGFISVITGE